MDVSPDSRSRRHRTPRRQSGVAAIEFALVFTLLFLALYGIATFGAVLYFRQAVARAAEDGARAATFRPKVMGAVAADRLLAIDEIKSVVHDALANSLIVPVAQNTDAAARRKWIVETVDVSVTPSGTVVTVTVGYPYDKNRLLPSIPFMDISRWMPGNLTSKATAVVSS
ncbi:TadE/TadG family type IV pilus assembly protein [Variovorax sp. LT1R16]|uniref:TadE/TadG family type IV pilus assembly protein n=1 Tax=Variovorax sp. LT1R16 TaxID=3443728 RepID=UPI003F489249